MATVVVAANPRKPGESLDFRRCPDCASLIVHDGAFTEFTESDDSYSLAWRHYVQLGAGIDAMVRPIERVARRPDAPPASLLDVGCGFGFVVDYWHHVECAPAFGVEPSLFGRRGHEMLTQDVHIGLLANVPALRDRQYDIVFSSEVIEHVPDPLAFLAELKARLTPQGTLIVTTPGADFVAPGNSLSAMLGVLSPGLHKMLLSEQALRTLLGRAGFAHVVVETQAERLVGWASAVPLRLDDAGPEVRERQIAYLARRSLEPGLDPDLVLGFAFRALRELVNAGRFDEAEPQLRLLRQTIQDRHAIDIADPAAVLAAIGPVCTMGEYEHAAPFSLGCILFFAGRMARRGRGGGLDAETCFRLAHQVITHSLVLSPEYFQEGETLVWNAAFEEGSAALQAGHFERALACLAPLALAGVDGSDRPHHVPVPEELTRRARAESAAATLALDHEREAMRQARERSHPLTVLLRRLAGPRGSVRWLATHPLRLLVRLGRRAGR